MSNAKHQNDVVMKTLVNELETAKENAAAKGFTISNESEDFIGFRNPANFVYYWFRILNMSDGNVYLTFDHIYSQNTGKTSKNYRRAYTFKSNYLGI
jgi:hypothetical protein